jgi:PAS domain S-box-containing protein
MTLAAARRRLRRNSRTVTATAVAALLAQATLALADPSSTRVAVAALALLTAAGLAVARPAADDPQEVSDRDRANARRLACADATGREVIWEVDRAGVMTYISGAARDMFGAEPDQLVGKSVFELVAPSDQPDARALLTECVRDRCGWSDMIFEIRRSDGATRLIETTSVVQLDAAGEVAGFSATTHRLDAEAQQRFEQRRLRERITHVLETGEVQTAFQPIVDVDSGAAAGYEALSRFDAEPAQGPDKWFADAERVGLGVELDCLAVRAALSSAARLPREAYVSVNTTPETVRSGRLADLVRAAPVAADRIVVEITEHVSVEDYHALHEPLRVLRALGVRLAVDDAGSGFASFRHILRLEPHFIKLDRDLIHGIDSDPARRALAAAVVMFARDLGAAVVAEGVETAEELAMVAHLGIDAAQGYLLGRPSAERTAWFAHRLQPLARYAERYPDRTRRSS